MVGMEKIICYTDGGARGNPGPAAAGVYIVNQSGDFIKEVKQTLGEGTNNFAEYMGVVLALNTLKKLYGKKTKTMLFDFRLDSELVTKQLNHQYQIKETSLMPHFMVIHNLRISHFPHLTLTHIPRAKNKEADRLVNEALDE